MGPLSRRRIVVTRTREQSSTLADELRALGAEVIEVPTIRIEPPASYAPLDAALARLAEFDVLLVTSANTARILRKRQPLPWVSQPYTVAVGPATAEALRTAGLRVDLQPELSVAESVLRVLAPEARGKQMLLVRAEQARNTLPEGLRAAGASVHVVEAYRTMVDDRAMPLLRDLFAPGSVEVDAVTFTSSSTVQNFFLLLGNEAAGDALVRSAACSIGPVTSATLRSLGVEPATEAMHFDVQGLVAAIKQLLQRV